jgi:hypothetical protein
MVDPNLYLKTFKADYPVGHYYLTSNQKIFHTLDISYLRLAY